MKRKRPWNIINVPIYSIATASGDKTNMNICTYATAVSLSPKRYAVAIYHDTQTLANVRASGEMVLQILEADQYKLVNVLGKKSGHLYDKEKYLAKKDALCFWRKWKVLKDACAWIELKVLSAQSAGDHELFICDVTAYKTLNNDNVLMLDDLRFRKLVII